MNKLTDLSLPISYIVFYLMWEESLLVLFIVFEMWEKRAGEIKNKEPALILVYFRLIMSY